MRLAHIDTLSREAAMTRLRRWTRTAVAIAGAAAALTGAVTLAACGGTSGGSGTPLPASSSATATPSTPAGSPSPQPSPLITSGPPPAAAVNTVRAFWTLVGQGQLKQAQDTLTTPQSELRLWDGTDIAAARFVGVVPGMTGHGPVAGATIGFAVQVWIKPSPSGPAWGDTGVHELFENVVRMSVGSWRMVASGTGP
jgi:hypothetical protein